MISYAQNFEDVMVARLFDPDYQGFYVDIGAAHPDFLSVTRHFYDRGWSGINVEPSLRFYPLLCEARPNDINLQCAIGNNPGSPCFTRYPSSPKIQRWSVVSLTGSPPPREHLRQEKSESACGSHRMHTDKLPASKRDAIVKRDGTARTKKFEE